MTGLDWAIIGFTALLGVYGYLQGFIVGAMALAGFALGAFAGTRLAPVVLHEGSRSPYAPLLGLAGALIVGVVFANVLELLGARVRFAERVSGLRVIDGLMGAALTACVALGIAWIVGAAAVDSSNSVPLRNEIRSSEILHALDKVLPPSGPVLDALARIDPLPSVRGPAATVGAPTRAILKTAGVHRAAPSVVRVYGMACGLGVEGSGWVVRRGLVVTNAHVVAGEDHTQVQVHGRGPDLAAEVVGLDVHDDVAVLRVPGLGLAPLQAAPSAPSGTAVAILGYPLDGAFDAEPGRLGQTETVRTQNAYGEGDVQRAITPLRGRVRPGNSGGPVVDRQGRVMATVFAAITGKARPGGFAIPNRLVLAQVKDAQARRLRPVSTGRCAE
ncbi:MAG TPA: MarP family serine protease [Solirubrobacteraceae bacterium]|nr:MarP family serine protease [Solirubrobacteraceae bacterium]